MKRFVFRAAALALCAAVGLSLAACGGSSSSGSSAPASSSAAATASFGSYTNFDYASFAYDQDQDANGHWQGVTAGDYVTLPADYAAIPLDAGAVTPTEADVQDALNDLLVGSATLQQVTDRPAASGDSVNINYKGTVDGVAFLGGEAAGYDLTLGSGAFIPGFEDQIVGHTPGETFDITVTFPDGYDDSSDSEGNPIVLSGAEAVFTVTLNHISVTVYPEVTDEWVAANMQEHYGITKASQVNEALYNQLLYNNQADYLYNYLMQNAVFSEELPAVVLNYEVCACLDYYNRYAVYLGTDLETFVCAQMGYSSVDAFLIEAEPAILQYCQEDLLYQALAEALEITVTEDDMAPYAEYIPSYGENYVRRQVMINLMMDKLIAGAAAAA